MVGPYLDIRIVRQATETMCSACYGTAQMNSSSTFEVVVRNALVGHIWRLMPQRAVYRNWYLGQGAFVRQHPDVQGFVRSYVETEDASAAIGSLFSATER